MLVYALFKSGLVGLCGSHCSVACIKCHIISIHANKWLIGFDMDCSPLGITVCANHFLQIYNIFDVSLPWLVLDNVLRGLTALIYWNKWWKLHCYPNVKCRTVSCVLSLRSPLLLSFLCMVVMSSFFFLLVLLCWIMHLLALQYQAGTQFLLF